MKTADILNTARELGEMLSESNELKELRSCEEKLFIDAEAQSLLKNYRQLQFDYEQAHMEQDMEKTEKIKEQMAAEQELMNKNKAISDYAYAKNVFDRLLNNINDILSFAINGEEGCSGGDCSGCSGCK